MLSGRALILLFLFVSVSGLFFVPRIALGDAQIPRYEIGDWWKYDDDFAVQGGSVNATGLLVIADEEMVVAGGVSYDVFRLTANITGAYTSKSFNGTWSNLYTVYSRRTDLATVRIVATITQSNATFWQTSIIENNNTSPAPETAYPLSVGKTWFYTATSSTNTTTYNSLNPTPVSNLSGGTANWQYRVDRTEDVTVAAGKFESYVILTNNTGSGHRTEIYYSPQVGAPVRFQDSVQSTGSLIQSQVLLDYSAWPYRSSVAISSRGQTYAVQLRTTASVSNIRQNETALSFQVSGEIQGSSGISGRANVSIPKRLNNTSVKVYVDSIQSSTTFSQNATHYQVYFEYVMSPRTVSLVYGTPQAATSFDSYIIAGIGVSLVAIAAGLAMFVLRRRKRSMTKNAVQSSTPGSST